jgi:hypothetical protein
MDKPLSNRKIAAALGISEGAIRKAKAAGRITGEMTVENVSKCLRLTMSAQSRVEIPVPIEEAVIIKKQVEKVYQELDNQPIIADIVFDDSDIGSLRGLPYIEIKAIREGILAKRDDLDLKIKEKSLCEASEVTKANQLSGRMVRESFEALPAKISGDLAALKNAKDVQVMLENKIREVLERISSAIG